MKTKSKAQAERIYTNKTVINRIPLKKGNFVHINKSAFRDNNLTDSAKILLIRLLNNNKDYVINTTVIATEFEWSNDKMAKAFKCLTDNHYASRTNIRNGKGCIIGYSYFISESKIPEEKELNEQVPNSDLPKSDIPKSDIPKSEIPKSEIPSSDNQRLINLQENKPTGNNLKEKKPTGKKHKGNKPTVATATESEFSNGEEIGVSVAPVVENFSFERIPVAPVIENISFEEQARERQEQLMVFAADAFKKIETTDEAEKGRIFNVVLDKIETYRLVSEEQIEDFISNNFF